MIEIQLILLFMIAAAVIAVEMKDLLSSVIAVGAAGIGLCMAFIVLKAPDLAVMQLVVEVLGLIILIRATIREDIPFSTSGRWLFNTITAVVFIAVFLTSAYFALKALPPFGSPAMRVSHVYIAEGLAKTGAANLVAAITLNYRALDTLGETTAIFIAVIGILALARRVSREKDR